MLRKGSKTQNKGLLQNEGNPKQPLILSPSEQEHKGSAPSPMFLTQAGLRNGKYVTMTGRSTYSFPLVPIYHYPDLYQGEQIMFS